jgi:hypothetical protein
MRPADLEDALQSTPFIPFDVRVDGKAIPVGHPEQVLLNKSKTVAVIVPDDHIHIGGTWSTSTRSLCAPGNATPLDLI